MSVKHYPLIFLVLLAIGVKIFSLNADNVERFYAVGAYPLISSFQRMLFGWVPFSIGDIFYAVAIIWLSVQFVKLIKAVKSRKFYVGVFFRKTFVIILAVYVSFNLLWGLNYNRRGIDYQLQLHSLDYSDSDLVQVTTVLADKLNNLQQGSLTTRKNLRRKRSLFAGAEEAYENTPFLRYRFASIKPSIYSYLGNYLGFTGYYNPFSGEAQVNTTVPEFVQPFTTCHEIGHQLGYAKESEANFAGFLSASASRDSAFLYSVYFDMYAYAARYLYLTDSLKLKEISNGLSPAVKQDIRELRDFYRRYDTPIETAIDKLYAEYLKANEQPTGKMSYNEVIAMLIAYHKKFGKI